MMRTYPSKVPRNRLSEPEQTLDISLFSKKDRVSSSPSRTWPTSKKSNAFHCAEACQYGVSSLGAGAERGIRKRTSSKAMVT